MFKVKIRPPAPYLYKKFFCRVTQCEIFVAQYHHGKDEPYVCVILGDMYSSDPRISDFKISEELMLNNVKARHWMELEN